MRQNQRDVLPLHFVRAHHPISADGERRGRAWLHVNSALSPEQSSRAAITLDISRRNNVEVTAHECRLNPKLQGRRPKNDYLPWPVRRQRSDQTIDETTGGCLPVNVWPPGLLERHDTL